jgi:Cof subfamily protein (haloacid dehalogenase superfamily)
MAMAYNAVPYQLIALDLDGTLLNTRHEMTDRARVALARVSRSGCHVILVSARPPRSVAGFARAIGLDAPYIALNGAVVIAPNGDFLHREVMSATDALMIREASRGHALVASFYSGFDCYVEAIDDTIEDETRIVGFGPAVSRLSGEMLQNVQKMLIMGAPQDVRGLYEELVCKGLGANLSFSKPEYLEISPAGVTKATGLAFVCRHLDVPASSVIAVGDSFNDVEMLRFAGLGVAMGNAPQAVKQVASLIIHSNDEDGVAQFVDNLRCSGSP